MFRGLAVIAGNFTRDTRGAASMEFVTIMPFVMIIIFMFGEIGVYTAKTVLLKRGVSLAIRDVRIGADPVLSPDDFRSSVCENSLFILDCNENLTVEMQPIDVADGANPGPIECVNRADPELTPVTTFIPGDRAQIMLVRVCLLANPIFPGIGFASGLQWDGTGYWLVARTAFMNEPGVGF